MPIHTSRFAAPSRRSAPALVAAALATALALGIVSPEAAAQPNAASPSNSTLKSSQPTPPNLEGRQNAALAYYQINDMLTREQMAELRDKFVELSSKDLPDVASRALLVERRAYIDKILQATRVPDCDWGIQYQEGFGALLPYLGTLRNYARILAFDARRCLAEKDTKGAAERYAAIFRLSVHASRGGVLICSLVGEAIQALACGNVQEQLDLGRLDIESARAILTAARVNVQDDTHDYLGALKIESFMAVDWVQGHYTGPDAGKNLAQDMGDITESEDDGSWEAIRAMDGATLSREVEKSRGYYAEATKAWTATDAAERFAKLAKDIQERKFGRVTATIPSFDKCYRSMNKGKEQLSKLIKNLEAFVRGEYVPPEPEGKREAAKGTTGTSPTATSPAAPSPASPNTSAPATPPK